MSKILVNFVFVCGVLLTFFGISLSLSSSPEVAHGANATLTVGVEPQSYMPFDLDYTLDIINEDGKVVESLVFNGVPSGTQTTSLVVGEKYSMAARVPTGVFCTIIFKGSGTPNVSFNSNFLGSDFIMPSAGLTVGLSLATTNPTLFTNTTII